MDRFTSIKAASRNLRDLIVDSVPASLSGSFIDIARLVQPITNQLQGKTAYIYSGAGNGQERTITSFTPANNRLGFEQAFTTLPSTNSNMVIFDHFRKDEYDNALDRIIGIAGQKYLDERVATLSLVGTQYEYAVPTGMVFINSIRLVPSGGSNYSDYIAEDYAERIYELPPHLWHIEANPLGSFVIIFDPRKVAISNFDGNSIRVMGQAKPVVTATDNATIPAELEEFVIAGASMLLASQRINENKEWQQKFYMFRDMTRELESYIFKPRRGKQVG